MPPIAAAVKPPLDFRFDDPAAISRASLLVHIGEGRGGEAHLEHWYKPFADARVPFFTVFRNRDAYAAAAKLFPSANTAYAAESQQIEALLAMCPALQAAFYVSNTGNAIHLIRFNRLTHVFLGHGDSDKSGSCHKFFRCYDEVWTAGEAHIDRFRSSGVRFDGVRFEIIGRPALRPELDAVFAPMLTGRFLYLPTWEGVFQEQDYSSLPMASALLRTTWNTTHAAPIVKLHPWTGRRLADLGKFESTLREPRHAFGMHLRVLKRGLPATIAMQSVDFLISDVSSVVTDFLIFDRPIFVYLPLGKGIALANSAIPLGKFAYTFESVRELQLLLAEVVGRGNDWLKKERESAIDYFFSRPHTLQDSFAGHVRRVCTPKGTS